MRRASLQPPKPTTPAMSITSNTLTVPSPHHYITPILSPATVTAPTRSPTRVNPNDLADGVDDDLFGSAAWKKKRGSTRRGAGKKTGSGRENDGRHDDVTHTKRWAVVRFMEQRAKKIHGYACAVRRWCKEVVGEGLRTWTDSGQQPAAEGGRGGSAVPSAVGTLRTGSRRGDITSQSLEQETMLICRNYIYHRLTLKGLMSKRVSVTPQPSLIADEVCLAGQELERLYPRVYTDVSRRISMTMTSAQLVRRALTSVLEDIFRSGVTWARLVAMVAIAAAFAEECVVQGHPNFVDDVVMSVGHFVTLRLSDWLLKQGGWDSFPTSRPPPVVNESMEGSVYLLVVGAVVLIVAIVLLLLLLYALSLGVT